MTVNTTQKNTFNWLNNPLIHQSHTFSDVVYTSSFIKEDPIVLACTIKRIREILSNDPTNHELNTCRKPVHLLSISEDENIISPYITTDDRELARRIREHYTQKLMWIYYAAIRLVCIEKILINSWPFLTIYTKTISVV